MAQSKQETLEIQTSPNITENDHNRSQYYGPLFLVSHETNSDGNIYYVDDPKKLPEKAVAIMARTSQVNTSTLLSNAMSQGKPISIIPAGRYWVGQDKLGWEVYKAKKEY